MCESRAWGEEALEALVRKNANQAQARKKPTGHAGIAMAITTKRANKRPEAPDQRCANSLDEHSSLANLVGTGMG
jgi:hypothetical protein